MQVLSKEEETKRCQDTVTRLILAGKELGFGGPERGVLSSGAS